MYVVTTLKCMLLLLLIDDGVVDAVLLQSHRVEALYVSQWPRRGHPALFIRLQIGADVVSDNL